MFNPPTSESLETRLAELRAEHLKCKQNIAQMEAQALRIEGAMTLIGELLASVKSEGA